VTGWVWVATKSTEFSDDGEGWGIKAMAVENKAESTDERLIAEAAREGSDGPAFRELVSRHQQRVWRICYRLLNNEHDAFDAAQEVFVRLFVNRAKFAGRSRFTTWLHAMAVRTCLSLRRGRGRRQRYEQAAAAEATRQGGSTPPRSVVRCDVMEMLDILTDEDRAMLILKYTEGYTFEELAEIFDLSISGCKMRVSRAKEKLRQRFGEDG